MTSIHGLELIKNNSLNRDLSFSINERETYSLKGLLPPLILTIKQQEKLVIWNLRERTTDLDKYIYLMDICSRNKRLFFYVAMNNIEEILPYIYTPTVGAACLKFGRLFNKPSGLFITINDVNEIETILSRWPEKDIKAICVTDGERILGLGDLGAHGMGIPLGKLALYTCLGGVDPSYCLPITIDVGTNNKNLLQDEFYLGLRQERAVGEVYENFVDKFMKTCVKIFGPDILIQFEDFGNHYAFHFLQKYRLSYCMFNDDIQGTAAVVVAGIINAAKLIGKKISENIYLFFGAGEASLGIASLLVMMMKEDGLTDVEARRNIYLIDSKGLIVENRPNGGLTLFKSEFAQKMDPMESLVQIIKTISPTFLIGASAQAGVFNAEVLETMKLLNNQPVIMALSNPTCKSECTAEAAYTYTKGKAIFCGGSPFGPFNYEDKILVPGQANNSYIFPGLAFSIIHCKIHPIQDKHFLEAAKALADQVTTSELNSGKIYPSISQIADVSLNVALAVCKYAYLTKTAHLQPEPVDKKTFLKERFFKPVYKKLPLSEILKK